VAHGRGLLLEDPLNRAVSREAEGALAAAAVRFEALLNQLAELHHDGKRRLAIWPHGPYYFFPFHLLPLGNGRIVADDWTVVLVPSLQSVVGGPRAGGRESLLAIASPDGGVSYGLAAEPDVIRQVEIVSKAFGVEPVQGAAATSARFLAMAEEVRFIHLAAHGAQYLPAPLFDAIYLADGPLCAHQVIHADLRGVELVTLSACESALLRFDLSDNLHGMAAAFLRAGAAAVIGALWPVQAAVASTFFAELYGCLARGQGKLPAFREAQSVTRKKHPHFRDWAAFTMIGDCWERLSDAVI
jgi:CHAT domain-containing protein